MDLIYMNPQRQDVGVLQNYKLDLAYGCDENDFELAVSMKNHVCAAGFFLYIEGTEYGGIIRKIRVKTEEEEIIYGGDTWHGILGKKILEPDADKDYLVCSGEAHAIIARLLQRCGLSDLFRASAEYSGLTIKSYKMNRYISLYDGIRKMLDTADAKLKILVLFLQHPAAEVEILVQIEIEIRIERRLACQLALSIPVIPADVPTRITTVEVGADIIWDVGDDQLRRWDPVFFIILHRIPV